ncbi:MAG: PLP-dependent aminotransferase family protein [Thermoplasmatota archaeon]
MKSSEIRDLLAVSQQPGVISFGGGLPNSKAFPVHKIQRIVEEIIAEEPNVAFQYGTTKGQPKLREAIVDMAADEGIDADMDHVLITVGSQQALDLTGRVFLNPEDTIFLGLPTYLGGINVFRAYGANMVGVPVDRDGMNVDILEEKIIEAERNGKPGKLIYTVPTFQNPAGVEMSADRRRRIVELADEHELVLLEDDPYGKLRFEGEALPPLRALSDNVVHMATFSKVLSPGFRLAYVIAPNGVVDKMELAKQSVDLCTPTFTQCIARRFITEGHMDEHLPNIISMYRRKRDIMLDALEEYFPEGCTWTHPRGGMFLWATLPDHIDTREMFQDAIKEKVAYVHGRAFYVNGGGGNTMRLNFSNPSDEDVTEGIRRLGATIEKNL